MRFLETTYLNTKMESYYFISLELHSFIKIINYLISKSGPFLNLHQSRNEIDLSEIFISFKKLGDISKHCNELI